MGYAPYLYIAHDYNALSTAGKAAVCLLAPTCAGMGANVIAVFEYRGEGIRIDNLQEQPSDCDDFIMAKVFGMLILDGIIYSVLTRYLISLLNKVRFCLFDYSISLRIF